MAAHDIGPRNVRTLVLRSGSERAAAETPASGADGFSPVNETALRRMRMALTPIIAL